MVVMVRGRNIIRVNVRVRVRVRVRVVFWRQGYG